MNTLALVLLAAAINFPVWMTGSWKAPGVEEHWTSADGGLMIGMGRESHDGKTSFEFMRIERQNDTLVYQAMPGGNAPTPFTLKSLTKDRVVFENLQHDFPQRVIYWRKGAQLCARIEGTIQGQQQGDEWCWQRMK